MGMLKLAKSILSAVPEETLERNLKKFRAENPEASEAEEYRHILKKTVPGSVPLSPMWHRNELHSLLAACKPSKFGPATLFVTYTMNDAGAKPWEEVIEISALNKKFCKPYDTRASPTCRSSSLRCSFPA